jgi:hypothetical protein
MAQTLSGYITDTRRLLHDVNANFWTDAELTSYINDGRNTLVRDTGCNRVLQSYTAPYNVETIDFSGLPEGTKTIDILNINLYWGNSRVPLYYFPWTNFNAQLRYWQNYTGRPIAFSMYGPKKIFIGPKPDQAYVMELDTVVEVDPMTAGADVETLPNPFIEAVPFYAAYIAKYQEQSYGEAEIFKNEYTKHVMEALNGTFTRRLPTPFVSGY